MKKVKTEKKTETIEFSNSVRITFKLDTGAQTNLIPKWLFDKLPNVSITKSFVKLLNYDGHVINNLGKVTLECNVVNKPEKVRLEFFIVNNQNASAILGLEACQKLKLIKRIHAIELNTILNEFSDVFKGIGCLQRKHTIRIEENATPVAYNARKISLSIKNEVKTELDRLEKLDIIQKVIEPTDWVHPLVVVRKPTGKIRFCLDPKQLNKVIKREYFQIPSVEEILGELSGASVFSLLDANQGFYQIPLDDSSMRLCTFATPFGRYMFKRLPFGVSSAPEVFQKIFKQALEGIEGQINYIDDILVFGKDQKEHDKNLKAVLQRAREQDIKFNKNKCIFNTTELKFIGHIISKKGVRADPEKIKCILELATPTNKKELEQILGMITYISKFVPNLSCHTYELRKLLAKECMFVWNDNHEKAFNELKKILTTTPILQFFDLNKPITLSVDASKHGLGAVLLQNNLPVIYASRALTKTEENYAQIEKELLAVVFACTRFHQYIYGKRVTVESDHKPLTAIHKKALVNTPLRLQRMLIKLQLYDIEIVYKPGSQLYIADCLSRNFIKSTSATDNLHLTEIEAHVNLINKFLPISKSKFQEFKNTTKIDPVLSEVLKLVKDGWPREKNELSEKLKPYWLHREELVSLNDVLFKGNKIVVPEKIRSQMLDVIHYNHLGVTKCQLRARQCLFWPNINKDIENFVLNCETCLKYRKSNHKEPLIQTELPSNPWDLVGTDIYQYKGKNFLIVIDYFSKFIETGPISKLDSLHTVIQLKSIFSRHGIPKTLRSDNGTNFSSSEFKEFTKSWGIEHITSSPTHAQSNGMVERCIQTFKNMMKKAEDDEKDPYLCLLEYRNTPINSSIPSPSELLFNRRVNGLLPTTNIFISDDKQNLKDSFQKRQSEQKVAYDRNAKSLPEFNKNDKVRVQQMDKSSWQPATIVEKVNKPRTYLVKLKDGKVLERNRKFLIKDTVNKKTNYKFKPNFSNVRPPRPRRNLTIPFKLQDYELE